MKRRDSCKYSSYFQDPGEITFYISRQVTKKNLTLYFYNAIIIEPCRNYRRKKSGKKPKKILGKTGNTKVK